MHILWKRRGPQVGELAFAFALNAVLASRLTTSVAAVRASGAICAGKCQPDLRRRQRGAHSRFDGDRGDSVIMLEEPINTARRTLQRAGLSMREIDLIEVNQAFPSIPLAEMTIIEAL